MLIFWGEKMTATRQQYLLVQASQLWDSDCCYENKWSRSRQQLINAPIRVVWNKGNVLSKHVSHAFIRPKQRSGWKGQIILEMLLRHLSFCNKQILVQILSSWLSRQWSPSSSSAVRHTMWSAAKRDKKRRVLNKASPKDISPNKNSAGG